MTLFMHSRTVSSSLLEGGGVPSSGKAVCVTMVFMKKHNNKVNIRIYTGGKELYSYV